MKGRRGTGLGTPGAVTAFLGRENVWGENHGQCRGCDCSEPVQITILLLLAHRIKPKRRKKVLCLVGG